MYYKIENKECELYKKLFEMRSDELKIEETNKEAINNKIGLDWSVFLGYAGQQNFNRVTVYQGFMFKEPEKVDLKVWGEDTKNEGVFVPNRRTKVGREMSDFLANGLNGSFCMRVYDILGMPHPNRFIFPYIEIVGEKIILFLDDDTETIDENLIEITSKEFKELSTLKT